MKIYNLKNTSKKGFTLIEILVSLAIFIVVAIIAVGALLKVLDANRRSLSLKTTINNINFALESMSREMRVGSQYYCNTTSGTIPIDYSSTACTGQTGNVTIAFLASKSNSSCKYIYAYRFENQTLKKAEGGCNMPVTPNDYSQLISPDVVIENHKVTVVDAPYGNAFFWFGGYTGIKEKDREIFSIQTRVSQRINSSE